jgi:DNA-binding CsgD family transcriptional regulator
MAIVSRAAMPFAGTVTELPSGGLDAAVEMAGIGAATGEVRERARALTEPLRRALPPESSVWIAVLNSARTNYVSLAHVGEHVDDYEPVNPDIVTITEGLGLHRPGAPLFARERPVPVSRNPYWVERVLPSGFRDSVVTGLFTPDGRHVGTVSAMFRREAGDLTEVFRSMIALVAPIIATSVDPMRSLAAVARLVHDAVAGVVVTIEGEPHPLPGLPCHPLLVPGSALLAEVAARIAADDCMTSFLCPYPDGAGADRHVRITVLRMRSPIVADLGAVVTVSPPGDLRGLTPRELHVAGLLTLGWPNRRIATRLTVAERTVAAHVEHILMKLGAPSRTLAAVCATRLGLYVPDRLACRYRVPR